MRATKAQRRQAARLLVAWRKEGRPLKGADGTPLARLALTAATNRKGSS